MYHFCYLRTVHCSERQRIDSFIMISKISFAVPFKGWN